MSRIAFAAPRVGRRSGQSSERGAGIVEFALVALLLFTLSAGAFDYGQAWRTGLTANEAVRTGARVGSAAGPEREADFYALSGLKASLASGGQLDYVERVVVFRADSPDGAIPTVCKTGGGSGCQTISGADFRTAWESGSATSATNSSGCLNVASSKSWCPTTRNNVQQTAQYYGVWVKLRHDFLFPVMGAGTDIERTAVMRLEPKLE